MTLVCKDIRFSYGETEVLSGVSFEVPKGTLCALLGRNGSGKTTLLHSIGKMAKPGSGTITMDGMDLLGSPGSMVARKVSLVPQEHTEIFPFSVLDVVLMGRAPHLGWAKSPGALDRKLAMEALNELGAGKLARQSFNRISGGERQIVLLARALVQSRDTMLLDEPTNHLDFNNQYLLLGRIRELCRSGNMRVLASMHDPNMAMMFADHVVMLKGGRVVASGPPREVMTAHAVGRLYDTETRHTALPDGRHLFTPACAFEKEPIMDKKKARVVIVTGDPGSGKSTLVERLTGKLKEQGFKCSGFMARGFWEGGVRSGFDIETLDRGDVLPLARRVSGRIGMPFDFFDDGISSGLAALEPQRCEGADMVVVDEVGKLESAGKGWAPKLSGLLELDGPLHVWVVRRSLVDEVKSIWELEDPLVIDAVESDAFEKLERKCCNLLHHGG